MAGELDNYKTHTFHASQNISILGNLQNAWHFNDWYSIFMDSYHVNKQDKQDKKFVVFKTFCTPSIFIKKMPQGIVCSVKFCLKYVSM